MNQEQLYKALGDIREDYIRDAHMTVNKKPRPVWIRWAAMAACFCLLLTALIAAPHFFKEPIPTEPPHTSRPQTLPQYIPAYSSPELDVLYKEAPYSVLLPTKVPETFAFTSSYKTEYDPIANPDNKQYLWLGFHSEQHPSSMEIKVTEYDGKGAITDPAETDTYNLSLYYDYQKTPGAVGADSPDVLAALFRAEDLCVPIVEKRMYVFDDGLCKAEIQVLCGEHIVAYHYAGAEISAQALYDAISSSLYFREMPNSEGKTETPGITDEILNGTLDGGADITVDAEDPSPEIPEIMNGILDGGANIAIDSTP